MTDIIAGLTANWLAGRQAKSLSAARAKKIADDPDLPQKDYQQSREAMLGKDFSTAPAGQACIPCMCNAKAARRAERLNPVSQGVNGCPDHADAATRLRRDMDQVEHARVAKAVYLKYDPEAAADLKAPPPGFLDATDDDLASLKLKPEMLAPDNTEFRAAVYKKDTRGVGRQPAAAVRCGVSRLDLGARGLAEQLRPEREQ